jgi:hypothetical protein
MHKKNWLHAFNFLDPSSWSRNSYQVNTWPLSCGYATTCTWIHSHVHVDTWACAHGYITGRYTWETILIRFKLFPRYGLGCYPQGFEQIMYSGPYHKSQLCEVAIARNYLKSQIYLRIRSHTGNGVGSWIREPGRFDSWQKPEVEDIVRPSL